MTSRIKIKRNTKQTCTFPIGYRGTYTDRIQRIPEAILLFFLFTLLLNTKSTVAFCACFSLHTECIVLIAAIKLCGFGGNRGYTYLCSGQSALMEASSIFPAINVYILLSIKLHARRFFKFRTLVGEYDWILHFNDVKVKAFVVIVKRCVTGRVFKDRRQWLVLSFQSSLEWTLL